MRTACSVCRGWIRFPRRKGFTYASGGIMHGSCARRGMTQNERGGWSHPRGEQ